MKTLISFLFILTLVACSSAKTQAEKQSGFQALEALIDNAAFKIESNWAQPQVTTALAQLSGTGLIQPGSTVGNINLIGNPNFVKIEDSIVSAYLPFYGERRMAGAFATNKTGIEFEGIPSDYSTKRDKKNNYEIRFQIADKNHSTESYQVYIRINSNLNSEISIASSHRTTIRYSGKASAIEEDLN